MEKNLAGLRTIRQSRLDRKETEYRQKVAEFKRAQKLVIDAAAAIESAKETVSREKVLLSKKYMSGQINALDLQQWTKSEIELDKTIDLARENQRLAQENVKTIEQQMNTVKSDYRKFQLSIEKLDLLKTELQKNEF